MLVCAVKFLTKDNQKLYFKYLRSEILRYSVASSDGRYTREGEWANPQGLRAMQPYLGEAAYVFRGESS
jgi:hypothetical protein